MTSKTNLESAFFVLFAVFSLSLTAGNSHAHSGSLNKVAVDVCKEKEKSQSCRYEGGHSDLYIGSCQLISDTDLICVRNKPIQKIESANNETEKDHSVRKKTNILK